MAAFRPNVDIERLVVDTHGTFEPMDFEEELAISTSDNCSSSAEDTVFDTVIGHIEDIIMENGFQRLQTEFMDQYYEEFEDSEENKLTYTDIHKSYVDLIEKHLENELQRKIPGFTMSEFTKQLVARREDLDGEVFDILLTFSDFVVFKEMMLDHRADREGLVVDLSMGMTVTPVTPRGVSLPPDQSHDHGDQ